MYAEVQRRVTTEVPWISIYYSTPPFLSPICTERWYEARKIRCLVGETCSGQDVGPRGETSALLSRFPRSFISYSSPDVLPLRTLLYSPSTGELPESRDANLTCTTTNEEQEERDLNVFESVRCHLVLQSKVIAAVSICISHLSTHTKI